jgi:NAD(P)-dependent dehydrogenase (short-subunit alcohol dehydrogenase family)
MKTVIITGGNSGIGRQAAFQIAKQGHKVILACRNLEFANKTVKQIQEDTNNNQVFALKLDLSLLKNIKPFVNEFTEKFGHLDVLINNAADFDLSRKEPLITIEGHETQFITNLVSPILLSEALLHVLKTSDDPRIINISTQGLMVYPNIKFDFENVKGQIKYSPSTMYYQTKLGLMMASLYQRNLLKDTSVSIYGIRVTNVKIDMSRYSNISSFLKFMYSIKSKFSISADEMAKVYTELALGPKRQGFYFDEKLNEVKLNSFAYNTEAQDKLWNLIQSFNEVK